MLVLRHVPSPRYKIAMNAFLHPELETRARAHLTSRWTRLLRQPRHGRDQRPCAVHARRPIAWALAVEGEAGGRNGLTWRSNGTWRWLGAGMWRQSAAI